MRDSTGYRLFVPRSWQVAPLLPHGFIVMDRIWQIFNEPPINYNRFYEQPAYKRLKSVRELSGRNVVAIKQRKKA